MIEIQSEVNHFIRAIRESSAYQEYRLQKERIKKIPELQQQIDDFRERNFELQMQEPSEDLLDRVDAFEREYEEFRENPLVDDFLKAEVEFCRMIQEINTQIMEAVEFE